MDIHNPREAAFEIDPMFIERWSPRAFQPNPVESHRIMALFEAARWAPSCYNDQPWRFYYALSAPARKRFIQTLVPQNQRWAAQAPVLIYVTARKRFRHNGKPNRYGPFDAGAAWMAIALQAGKMGLYAHAMAGFDKEKAYDLINASPDVVDVLAAVAVGPPGDPSFLPKDLRATEKPNQRLATQELIHELQGKSD